MLFRTHLMFGILAVLLLVGFVSLVNDKIIFSAVVLIAAIVPDVDHSDSKLGKKLIFRPLQFFVKHRGIIHSLSFAIFVSVLLAIFWPVVSLGFFVGYSIHLLCDSFTKEGIAPFWPFKLRSYGFLTTGGNTENLIFLFGVVLCCFLLSVRFLFLWF